MMHNLGRKKVRLSVLVAFSFALPFFVYAQSIESSMGDILTLLRKVSGTIVILATFFFLWSVLQYVIAVSGGKILLDGKEVKNAKASKDFMVWGIIGLFVMLSFWGIVSFMQNTINLPTLSQKQPLVPNKIPSL